MQNDETQAPGKPGKYIESKYQTETLKALCAAHEGDSGALELVLRLATLGDEIGRLIEERAKTLSTTTSEVEIPNNGLKVRLEFERDVLRGEDCFYAHWRVNGVPHSTGHLHRARDRADVCTSKGMDLLLNEVADEMTRDIRKSLMNALEALLREMELAGELRYAKTRKDSYVDPRV